MDAKRKSNASIIKFDVKSCQHRSSVYEHENVIQRLGYVQTVDGGRTDNEDKARKDDKLTERSVRNLKEDDFDGNMVRLVKSKKFNLLHNQRKFVESLRDHCEEVACSLVQGDVILDMGRNVLTLEDAFGKSYLNIPDECTDRHPQVIYTDKGIGEKVVEHSSVPEGLNRGGGTTTTPMYADLGLGCHGQNVQSYTYGGVLLKALKDNIHKGICTHPLVVPTSINSSMDLCMRLEIMGQILAKDTVCTGYTGHYYLSQHCLLDNDFLTQCPESFTYAMFRFRICESDVSGLHDALCTGNYDCLMQGNLDDFLEQFDGVLGCRRLNYHEYFHQKSGRLLFLLLELCHGIEKALMLELLPCCAFCSSICTQLFLQASEVPKFIYVTQNGVDRNSRVHKEGEQLLSQEMDFKVKKKKMGFEILNCNHYARKSSNCKKSNLCLQHEKTALQGSLYIYNHQKPQEHQMVLTTIRELFCKGTKFLFEENDLNDVQFALKCIYSAVEAVAHDTKNALNFTKLYEKARANLSVIRKRPERMECIVLSSRDNELFEKGSYASSVQKLMKKDLNRIGVGGNGEVVEAFHQKQHLVIKRTLLRELEYSVVPTLDHKNLLPWYALVCGERSENRPGQLTCYQIMPKMTEDLSASIRAIGGSVHDHMLNCLQENIPKADISVRAELLRRNTSLVFRGVLEGLDYLHQQELVHRDVKASNILVKRPDACSNSTHTVFTCNCGPQWEVRIADFDSLGQVAVLRERAARRSKRAMSGGRGFLKVSATGTSGYRAPEIFEEFSSTDTKDPQYFSPASDMWAFGGVAIHTVMGFSCPSKQYQFGIMMLADKGMVNQRIKFTKGESEDLIARTLGLHHIKEGFPGEKWLDMINFVSRPLKIEPKDRPSAAALLQDLFILHYNPRDIPVRNINSANHPPPNTTTAPQSPRINQLQGGSALSTSLVTPYQPQEYLASYYSKTCI